VALITAAEEIAAALDKGDVKDVIKAVGGSVDKVSVVFSWPLSMGRCWTTGC